jgi:hypothetical protein
MVYICNAGARPRPLRLCRGNPESQIGNSRNISTSGLEQRMTLGTLVIGTRHGESKNR